MTNVIDQFSKDLNQFITILKSKNKSLSNILSKNKFINEKKPVKNFILYHESYEEKFSLIMNEIIDNLEKYQESQDIKYLRKVFGRYPNYSHLSASGKLEKLRELFYLFCKQLLMKAREEVKKHHAIIKSFPKVEEIFQSYFEELIINHQDKRYSSGRLFDIINQINGFYGPIYQQKSEAKIEEKGLAKIYSKLKPIEEVYDEVWEPNIILYGLRPRINIHLYYKEIRFTAVKSILKKSSQRYSQSRQTHDITQYGYDLLLSLPEKTLLQMILKTLRNVLKVGLLTYREEVSLAPIYNLC